MHERLCRGDVLMVEDVAQAPDAMLAAEWASLAPAALEAREEAQRLESRLKQVTDEIIARKGVGEAIRTTHGAVVVVPPQRKPSARVDMAAVSAFREELLSMGVVEEETVLSRPKVSDIRAHAAQLIAAGIDINRIIQQPTGFPEVQFVPNTQEAA